MRPRSPTFEPAQLRWIRQWRAALARHDDDWPKRPAELKVLSLGDRARLRRASSTWELAGDPAALILSHGLVQRRKKLTPEATPSDYRRLGLIAGVLATVEGDLDRSMSEKGDAGRFEIRTLGHRLGQSEDGAPRMSELRFRRMLAAAEPEDLLRQWRRAVHLAGRKANVASLADDLYTWLKELDDPEAQADRSVRFHWAYDYYQQPRGMAPDGDSSPALEAAE